MFSVKGWNVSADKLKTETASPSASKKRKRSGTESSKISASHIGGLWEKIIEHKETEEPNSSAGAAKADRKRQKLADDGKPKEGQKEKKDKQPKDKSKNKKPNRAPEPQSEKDAKAEDAFGEDDEWGGIGDEPATEARDETPKKKKRRDKRAKDETNSPHGETTSPQAKKEKKAKGPAETAKPAPPAPAVKLTPLQATMREKLVSARFRHLNETLYTRPSAEAFKLFQESPEMFGEYHEGFRRQVDVWPENPVVGYISDIQARAKQRFPPKDRTAPGAVLPLPRTQGTCIIADLGCGDAALAAALQKVQRKLHLDIKSFDLQTGGSPLITRADIANLPLRDGSVDVAVFCLALMGTNWIDFIEEAYRVLHWKGELWVAEIKSRFVQPGKRKVVEHSVGNRRKLAGPGKAGKKLDSGAAEDVSNADELAVEVDGADDRRQETDVSAFVQVLQKRGFVLRGELDEAVDLSNKMFVKMCFIKGAPATRGKCVDQARMAAAAAAQGKAKKKFITEGDEDEITPAEEAKLLKPCVYKIR
jgi:ribosomal RNA-processing protein 8